MSFVLAIGVGLVITADDDVSARSENAKRYPTLASVMADRERLIRTMSNPRSQGDAGLFDQARPFFVADDPPEPPPHPRLPPCDLFIWSEYQQGWIMQIGDGVEPVFRIAVGCAGDPWRRIIAAVAEVECLKRVEALWELCRRAERTNRRARHWLCARYEYWSDLAERWREWGAKVPRP